MKSDIEDGSDEEAYRNFIAICEDAGEKENVPGEKLVGESGENENDPVKRPNTKQDQFEKITEFANGENIPRI